MRVKFTQVSQGPDDVHGVIHDNNRAGTAHRPGLSQGVKIVRQIEHVGFHQHVLALGIFLLKLKFLTGLQHFGGGSAGNDGLQFPAVPQTATEFGIIDQFTNGGLAHFNFVITRTLHLAAETDDARAGVVRRAESGKLRAPHFHNVLHIAEGLNVVDNGRAHPQAEHCRKIGRLDAGIRAFAFEGFDQAGFFTANISARAAVHIHFQIITGAQDIFTQEIFSLRFRQGLDQNLCAFGHLTTNIDIRQMNVVRKTRDDHPLDQLVRILVHDLPVLEGARFRFIGVANQINRLTAPAVDKAPFKPAGKTRAPAPTQTGQFHVIANLFLR